MLQLELFNTYATGFKTSDRLKVLVGCEYSGVIRNAFAAKGCDAWSCDIIPSESETPGNHFLCDVREVIDRGWDIAIFHPPCTALAVSGARWFPEKQAEIERSLNFVKELMNAPIPRIAIENPVGLINSLICKPTQIIHPWQFGEAENKSTCLWLKNLPKLTPTKVIPKSDRKNTLYRLPPSADRGKLRSKTFAGIANVMAKQWTEYCL